MNNDEDNEQNTDDSRGEEKIVSELSEQKNKKRSSRSRGSSGKKSKSSKKRKQREPSGEKELEQEMEIATTKNVLSNASKQRILRDQCTQTPIKVILNSKHSNKGSSKKKSVNIM